MNPLRHAASSIFSTKTKNRLHKSEAQLAAARYGWPAKKMKIIGVTGTNGKTSVSHYTAQILGETGHKVGATTTVDILVNGQRRINKSKMTTMSSWTLQGYLREFAEAGCEYAIVETTSHALDQNRVHGLYYDTVALTNITHEHLDYHKTMSAYQAAKEKLFAHRPRVAIVNADDPAAEKFLTYPSIQKFTYGILDGLRPKTALANPDFSASRIKMSGSKTNFFLKTPFGESEVTIPLIGRFTVANVLAATAITAAQGVPFQQIVTTLARLEAVEGRLEVVNAGQPFTVVVDFAHTPDALQQVYGTLRPLVTGRLIAVLGSMGNRDKTKRPILGALAARYADLVIVTNEDPVNEKPRAIIDEVAEGVTRGRPNTKKEANSGEGTWWWRVDDRRDAINKALNLAKPNDMVVITGKGGEHVMAVGNKLIPWNDVEVVKEILSQQKN